MRCSTRSNLDVHVLDSVAAPAVDSPQKDGLGFAELGELLRALLAGPALGMQVTIYDPDRDPDAVAGRALVDCLTTALAS
ncbi:arginase family protein [Alsobacter sp. KACC 23698]|uniref:Arginase family protein n=1 Tax=Alsobacter sp. KACC 23698 TaxID=3149229 RepID=A0AAU7JEB7_9HYPH